jgi:hypothetical protein
MASPETAARRVRDGDEEVECEAVLFAWYDAYKNKTGEEFPQDGTSSSDVTTAGIKGVPWKEEDLERLYPKLCKRFFD